MLSYFISSSINSTLVNIKRIYVYTYRSAWDEQYRCMDLVAYRYFPHAHFIPIVGVGKRGAYQLVHGDLPRQHSFGTTLRFTGPVPADSRQ